MPEEKVIHDPVHGSIRLSGLVLELVDTPEVQRLRGIKQLGLANLVFPGANHMRFEHALGTAYLVERLGHDLELPEEELNLLLASAVLHDIGHPAFSHTLEYLMKDYLGKGHMELAGDILKGEESIQWEEELEILHKLGVPNAASVLSNHSISPDEVAGILLGKHRKPYLGQIIHSDIDVDQMDYLMRDSHFTGVALGMIDVDRLRRTLIVHKGRLAIESKGIEAVEGFLTARALMFTSVYFHHAVRIAEMMLANAVEHSIEHQGAVTKENFYRMTDAELIEHLYAVPGYPREIITRLRYRRLFKTAYVEERKELTKAEKKRFLKTYGNWRHTRELQNEIADEAGLPRGYVILDVPIVDLIISEPRLGKVEIPALADDKLIKLSKLSPIAEALKKRQAPRYLLRVATAAEHITRVRQAVKKVLS
jgi:hypothetical protein